MKVFEKLKLNKFIPVSVPRNRDLYARVGGRIPPIGSYGMTAEIAKSKLDIIADDVAFVDAQILMDNQMPLNSPTA